jgi:hypothetical protein
VRRGAKTTERHGVLSRTRRVGHRRDSENETHRPSCRFTRWLRDSGPGALASGTPTYHLIGNPIIAGMPSRPGAEFYAVAFRLNRQLPRASDGRIEGGVTAGPGGSSLGTLGKNKASACYTGEATSARTPLAAATRSPSRLAPFRSTRRATLSGKAVVRR